MLTRLLCVLTLVLTTNLAQAQPPAIVGAAPTLRVVTGVDDKKGVVYFTETLTRYVPVVKTIVVIENGQQVNKNVTETVAVMEQRVIVIDLTKSRVITPNGKQLPIDDVWKRLKTNTVIALSADSNTPAAAYLNAFNEQTLIVIPPPPVMAPPAKT